MWLHYLHFFFAVFGFAETVFTEPERGQDYQVQAGFLSGRPDTRIVLNITLVDGSAGTNTLKFILNNLLTCMQKERWILGL